MIEEIDKILTRIGKKNLSLILKDSNSETLGII